LAKTPGLSVKTLKIIKSADIIRAPVSPVSSSSEGLNLHDVYNELREYYAPPLLGSGLTVAVLDSGILDTHEALAGKVVYTKNCSDSPDARDIFDHGTGVAYLIAGQLGEKSGVAPGAKLMNIKVLDNNGTGTDENLVEGVEEVCDLVEAAINEGLVPTDDMYPNTINLSVGGEDDGDPDNPMRLACQTAVQDWGIQVVASAGNFGPGISTIIIPAVDLSVIAVGGIKSWEFVIWPQSSRGPTLEGFVKPDLVCWAEELEVASSKGETEFKVASGTSYAAPTLVGVDGLLWDLTRRIYGEDVRITYYDWLPYAPYYVVKPEDVPLIKDNSYGYGIPAVGPMVRQLTGPVSPVSSMIEMMIPMMMLQAMMPMMVI